eukprot:6789118-Prymnesium_polylepis.1
MRTWRETGKYSVRRIDVVRAQYYDLYVYVVHRKRNRRKPVKRRDRDAACALFTTTPQSAARPLSLETGGARNAVRAAPRAYSLTLRRVKKIMQTLCAFRWWTPAALPRWRRTASSGRYPKLAATMIILEALATVCWAGSLTDPDGLQRPQPIPVPPMAPPLPPSPPYLLPAKRRRAGEMPPGPEDSAMALNESIAHAIRHSFSHLVIRAGTYRFSNNLLTVSHARDMLIEVEPGTTFTFRVLGEKDAGVALYNCSN